jgi:hypothetical protein
MGLSSSAPSSRARPILACAASALLLLLRATCAAASVQELTVAGVGIHLEYEPAQFAHGEEPILDWVRRAAQIVAAYYGRFPVNHLRLTLQALSSGGVHGGKTFGEPQAYIRVGVGREVTAAELAADWVLVHEMTHLALPDTGEAHAWLSEGIATYVEGVARVQAGNREQTDVWAEELRAMPRGLPQPGDEGLDRTHTWGRTYWGGAMFCLLADVTIHERTGNRFGLQDALRAVLNASGGLASDWPIERVLKAGDAGVGVAVLEELYQQYGKSAAAPDLQKLWHDLGVEDTDGEVRLNDAAPLAPVRRAIMQRR